MKFKKISIVFLTIIASLLIYKNINSNFEHTLLINTYQIKGIGELTFFKLIKNNQNLFKKTKTKYDGSHQIKIIKFKDTNQKDLNFLKIIKLIKIEEYEYKILKKKIAKDIVYILFYYLISIIFLFQITKKN